MYLKPIIRDLVNRSIHEGRTMHPEFAQHTNLKSKYSDIRLQCLYDINEDIDLRFLLKLFSSAEILRDEEGSIRRSFWSLNKQFIIPLEHLTHILQTSLQGDCAYSNKYSLDSLNRFPEEVYPHQSLIPTPNKIISDIIINEITEDPLRIRKNELRRDFRFWNEVIERNAIEEETNLQYVLASSCHMIYEVLSSFTYQINSSSSRYGKSVSSHKKEANIALIESWDNTQAMMEADFELDQRRQAEEQGEINP
ncbi:hypothetical protein Tco_0245394 [Tanacetum coccineum]